jgi:hypothetical protein
MSLYILDGKGWPSGEMVICYGFDKRRLDWGAEATGMQEVD